MEIVASRVVRRKRLFALGFQPIVSHFPQPLGRVHADHREPARLPFQVGLVLTGLFQQRIEQAEHLARDKPFSILLGLAGRGIRVGDQFLDTGVFKNAGLVGGEHPQFERAAHRLGETLGSHVALQAFIKFLVHFRDAFDTFLIALRKVLVEQFDRPFHLGALLGTDRGVFRQIVDVGHEIIEATALCNPPRTLRPFIGVCLRFCGILAGENHRGRDRCARCEKHRSAHKQPPESHRTHP